MKIIEITERTPLLIQQLLEIWERSVRATHLFLSDREIEKIKDYVPQALNEIPHLIVLEAEYPIAFMGIDGQKLEMLFISSEARGKGFGKRSVQYGIK
ncbi:GNAT family N-acetyltransferase, partial [Lactonifactor longoviformis]|uniref:GNAT family N-acetyltransferase n=1 Tax=Lactonifactor longoviformis TaxID=341220 RepID=UPI000CDABBFB